MFQLRTMCKYWVILFFIDDRWTRWRKYQTIISKGKRCASQKWSRCTFSLVTLTNNDLGTKTSIAFRVPDLPYIFTPLTLQLFFNFGQFVLSALVQIFRIFCYHYVFKLFTRNNCILKQLHAKFSHFCIIFIMHISWPKKKKESWSTYLSFFIYVTLNNFCSLFNRGN